MVEKIILSRGGVYLARLDPAKGAEIGKIRPVIILMSQYILDQVPPVVFICPLSSYSKEEFSGLHLEISPRDNLEVLSYALVEHCRSIATRRLLRPRLAQLTTSELGEILRRLRYMAD